jgi:DNA-binding IclR family transcriptional regulator
MEGRPADLIQTVSRAFRILEKLGDNPGGLSAKQAAHRCGIALPTTYHLLRTLSYERYVVRRPEGTYVLGLEVADRFRDLLASMQRPPNIHEVLRHLTEVTGHTASFAQIIDGRVVITDRFEGPHSPHLEDLVVGFAEGVHATAFGKALLSTIPPPARHALLREQGMRPFTGRTIVDPEKLDHELRAQARRSMFAEQGQYRDEVGCAAVLVGGTQPGALGMSAGLERWQAVGSLLARQLRLAATDLTPKTAGQSGG